MSKLYVPLSVGVALLMHLLFGWQFAIAGAVVAGALVKRYPVMAGALTLTMSWGALVIYNFTVAAEETTEMVTIMGSLIGDIPPFMVVVITLLISAVLGAAGGWLGSVPKRKK